MIGENGYPETPEWSPPEPRCCPFPACSVCQLEPADDEHIIRGTE